MTELGALIRMVEQVRAALPNAQPSAELAELSWDVILDEMRAPAAQPARALRRGRPMNHEQQALCDYLETIVKSLMAKRAATDGAPHETHPDGSGDVPDRGARYADRHQLVRHRSAVGQHLLSGLPQHPRPDAALHDEQHRERHVHQLLLIQLLLMRTDRLTLARAFEDAALSATKPSMCRRGVRCHPRERGDQGRYRCRQGRSGTSADRTQCAHRPLVERRLMTRLGGMMVVLAGLLFAALHYWPSHG
jgi:hypothetical protein